MVRKLSLILSHNTVLMDGKEYIKLEENEKRKKLVLKPDKKNINFITIGRLSPEKNHISLIRAFYNCYKSNKNIRLYIVGNGNLYDGLKSEIEKLHLNDVIYLVGYTVNPFELLKLCDCFVLPSLYEGMGMVVLEAFTLGKAVISSDIEGPKDFIKSYYGILTKPTIKGLETAMSSYIKDGMKMKKFDYKKFNRNAIELFYDNVLGGNENGN